MSYTYRIDENNAIYIYTEGIEEPIFFQPHWPDTTPWADQAEATAWAEAKIAEVTDLDAPMAGLSPDKPTMPKPTPFEMAENNLRAMGLSVNDLKLLLGL